MIGAPSYGTKKTDITTPYINGYIFSYIFCTILPTWLFSGIVWQRWLEVDMIYPKEEDQRRAMEAAQPLLRALHDDLHAGFARYWGEEYSDAVRADHSARTQACIIYDHAERLFRSRESSIPGLIFLNINGLILGNFRDQVIIRFKKVDAEGRHANIQTSQQIDYDDQQAFAEFPPEAFRLVAGYESNFTLTHIERIMIARQISKTIYWTSQVNVIDEAVKWEDNTRPQIFEHDLSNYQPPARRRRSGG